MMLLGFFTAGAVMGWVIHRAATDGLMLAQEGAHKRELTEAFDEVKRLRAQVAELIGKE